MTALNVILTDEYASIATDTLGSSSIGKSFNVPKVMPVPHMHLAIATRGKYEMLTKVVAAVCSATYDYESARDFLGQAYQELGIGDTEIVVAGWSAKGPAAFIISAINTDGKVVEIERALVTPTVPEAAFAEFGEDPIRGLPKLMQRQNDLHDIVGGYIAITQVGRDVIETYVAGKLKAPAVRPPRRAAALPVVMTAGKMS